METLNEKENTMKLNVKRYLDIIGNNGVDGETVMFAVGLSPKTYQWIMDSQNTELSTIERIADFIGCETSDICLSDSLTITENVIEFLKDQKQATLTFSQGRYITKLRKLAESHPQECQIITENQDKSICARVPVSWVKINPPRTYSEEVLKSKADSFRRNVLNQNNCFDVNS